MALRQPVTSVSPVSVCFQIPALSNAQFYQIPFILFAAANSKQKSLSAKCKNARRTSGSHEALGTFPNFIPWEEAETQNHRSVVILKQSCDGPYCPIKTFLYLFTFFCTSRFFFIFFYNMLVYDVFSTLEAPMQR